MFGRNKAEEEKKESRQERKERERIEKKEEKALLRMREEEWKREQERQQLAQEMEKQQKDAAEQAKKERLQDLQSRLSFYKQMWDKDGVIQFKNGRMAILQRKWGFQVEFIVAFDDLTREGYELKAIDEGKTAGDSYTGGTNSFYYFQRQEEKEQDEQH